MWPRPSSGSSGGCRTSSCNIAPGRAGAVRSWPTARDRRGVRKWATGCSSKRVPKLSKAVAGHAPGRRPLRGPFDVVAARGNVADIRDAATGGVIKGVHGDFLIGVPNMVGDAERPELLVGGGPSR